MDDHCGTCFPASGELARLAENAQAGRREPFVGTGDPDTVLACEHGEWRLGDVITGPKPACTELTKAGEPCKGTPGPDGLCAAHKQRGDGGEGPAGAAGDADPQAEEAGDPGAEGQAGGGSQEGGENPGREQEEGRG